MRPQEVSSGVAQLHAEMARQHGDALQTYDDAREMASEIAGAVRSAGRLLLIGMGGSHWINRAACPYYVRAGIDATCHVASEYIRSPLPGSNVMLLTSQSGNSGEIVRLLDLGLASDPSFGLTLESSSTLALRLPSLVGHGGTEAAYAATRSLLVTLAMHAAILSGLDAGTVTPPKAGFNPDPHERSAAIDRIRTARSAIMVARGVDQGVMDAAALSLMEVARIPVLGLEAGQFRHGPFEMMDGSSAVVFLRSRGSEADDLRPLIEECIACAITPVVFDASVREPVNGATTVTLPAASGLELAFIALPAIQEVLVDAADRMVENAGVPQRSLKVTSAEVG